MDNLFGDSPRTKPEIKNQPLADRMRPATIDDIIGQSHLLGEDGPLRRFFDGGDFPSMIFWGPPGVGKTTFALLVAEKTDYEFTRISAIESGVKEIRALIANAQTLLRRGKKNLLFIDEIHRFNKSQQDSLLHAVETGIITLVGATTENPSFEVNSALLSRCQVYRLLPLSDDEIRQVVSRAIEHDRILSQYKIEVENMDFLVKISGGDARTALNALDLAVKFSTARNGSIKITHRTLERALQQKTAQYDKAGESHYDTISAFIKSLRGSDPDAALFWMAKMIESGEDPKFIARRMVIFASEDIGNADPMALMLAVTVFQAVTMIGMPEARINLAQAATYLACAEKSNSSYLGIDSALSMIRGGANQSVPLHLRNAPTQLMKDENYGKEYKYPHDFEGHFVEENYFPPGIGTPVFYRPTENGKEEEISIRTKKRWKNRYGNEE